MSPIIRTALAASLLMSAATVMAQASCTLTNYSVVSYDHGGAYVAGLLEGRAVNYLAVCGSSAGTVDCSLQQTNRNLAVALTAQARGKPLQLYFANAASCAAVTPYTNVTGIWIDP